MILPAPFIDPRLLRADAHEAQIASRCSEAASASRIDTGVAIVEQWRQGGGLPC